MNKFKIAIIGGPDVDARIELMKLLKSDFELFAVGSNKKLECVFSEAGIKFYYYPLYRRFNPFKDLISIYSLIRILKKTRPQIVHAYDTKPNVLARLAARLSGVPVIVGTITGLGSLYMADENKASVFRLIYETLQRLACQVSRYTIFYNSDDANYFISRKIVSTQKVRVIPGSGISLDRFSAENIKPEDLERIRTELNIIPGQLVITMIARLVRSKGVFAFAEFAQQLSNQYPHVLFLLVGPQDNESLDALGSEDIQKISRFVTWLGERKDIEQILAITDIFVLPSGREGIPRVLMEAAAMGLPLIATDMPGCRDVVIDGSNGFLIPTNDSRAFEQAIIELITHPEVRHQCGVVSRNHALEKFDLKKIATMLSDIYRELLIQKGIEQ